MDLDTHLPYRLANMSLRIRRATSERFIRKTGISAREWRALGMLGIKGSMTPCDLSALTGMDRATISRAASHLVKLGLVERIPHEKDNRSLVLQLTAQGTKRCAEIVPKMARSGELCKNLFSPGEFALFIEFLDRMDQAISGNLFEDDVTASKLQNNGATSDQYVGG